VQDAAVDADSLAAYAAAEELGLLNLRVTAAQSWDRESGWDQLTGFIDLRDQHSSSLIDAGTLKILQDGVMETFTVALLQPCLTPDAGRGISMFDQDSLNRIITAADVAGFQLHFHVIGDDAVWQSRDALEQALGARTNPCPAHFCQTRPDRQG